MNDIRFADHITTSYDTRVAAEHDEDVVLTIEGYSTPEVEGKTRIILGFTDGTGVWANNGMLRVLASMSEFASGTVGRKVRLSTTEWSVRGETGVMFTIEPV